MKYLTNSLPKNIEKTDDKFYLSFPANQDNREQLISYLNVWYAQKKNLRNTANGTSGESICEYELWKSRFPQDINQYWKQQHERINAYYAPVKDSIKDKASPIETTSDFLCVIRNMIQSGLIFEVNTKMLDGNIAALKLSFLVDDLIEAKNKEIENNFAVFLYALDTLKSYGMPVRTELLTFEKGTQITYYLCLSQLAAFAENIEKIIIFELSKANKTKWEIDLFESTYEKDLKRFALNIKEEIEKVYKK